MANGAKIYTKDELKQIRYTLPKSWWRAAGLLRHKKLNPVAYQKKIRQEWENRLKRIEKEFSSRAKK